MKELRRSMVGTYDGDVPVHQSFDEANNIFVSPSGEIVRVGNDGDTTNTFADETERLAASDLTAGSVYWQMSDNSLWLLESIEPNLWIALGSANQAANYIYETAIIRDTMTFTEADIGKIARQLDDNTLWLLVNNDPKKWVQIITWDPDNTQLLQPGVANGLATLDENIKVPIEQVPTGTTSTTVALGDHDHVLVQAATLGHKIRTEAPAEPTPGDIWIVPL